MLYHWATGTRGLFPSTGIVWKTKSEWVETKAAVRLRGDEGKVNAEISGPIWLTAFLLINEGRLLVFSI